MRAVLAALVLFAAAPTYAAPITLYVATNGRDTWSGRYAAPAKDRRDGPLATPIGARDAIRRMRARSGVQSTARVLVRGGTYRMTAPLVLEPQDSDVSYEAYPGERPVLSGGRAIRGWTRGPGHLWSAKIPAVASGTWYFRQLFVNGRRRTRARTPNHGYFRLVAKGLPVRDPATGQETATDRTSFTYAPGDIRDWPDMAEANVVVYHSWETSRLRVKTVDLDKRLVTFTGPAAWPFQYWEKRQRYFVENIREALDAPGEWYLDRKAGVLLYYPLPGEDMRQAVVVAPALTNLVTLAGIAGTATEAARYVSHVSLKGISFQHEDWVLEPQGHSDPQAVVTAPAAVMADWARDCAFLDCEIAHVGDYALWLRRGCKRNVVRRCRIRDMGVGGVRIGEASDQGSDDAESSHNTIDDDHIYDGGYVYPAGVGVWVAQSSHNVISHNEIHDLNYSGMSIGWTWGDEPNRCHDNTIEYNHVHHVVRGELSDAGAIYTLGISTGSVIRNNVFHDVWPYPEPPYGWGIYLDATTSGYLVENNIVYNTLSGDFMCSNGGHENVVRNNVFAFTAQHMLWPYWAASPNTFERNIVYMTQGDLFMGFTEASLKARLAAHEPLGTWDRNVYRLPARSTFFGRTFPEWQSIGLDRDSVVADPLFVNPAAYDFRVKPGSPALKLGFRQIDTRRVGLYGPPAWVAEGRSARYAPTVLPKPPAPPGPVSVDDGFEKTPVGGSPENARVVGEENGASIRVTDEQAATGRHSLKFTDSAALEHSWDPHLFYEPHFTSGTVRESFDVRLEPDCVMFTEWRDSTAYPECNGPSLTMDGQGRVGTGSRHLTTVPVGVWVHVQIDAAVGPNAPREWRATIVIPGRPAEVYDHLPIPGGAFHAVHWLGFVSNAAVNSSFYIDNVKIGRTRAVR